MSIIQNQSVQQGGNELFFHKEFHHIFSVWDAMDELMSSSKFQFDQKWSKSLARVCAAMKTKINYNKALYYDEIYYKCAQSGTVVEDGPENEDSEDYQPRRKCKKKAKITNCPAKVTLRATDDKQRLWITELILNHNHDPPHESPKLCRRKKLEGIPSPEDSGTHAADKLESTATPISGNPIRKELDEAGPSGSRPPNNSHQHSASNTKTCSQADSLQLFPELEELFVKFRTNLAASTPGEYSVKIKKMKELLENSVINEPFEVRFTRELADVEVVINGDESEVVTSIHDLLLPTAAVSIEVQDSFDNKSTEIEHTDSLDEESIEDNHEDTSPIPGKALTEIELEDASTHAGDRCVSPTSTITTVSRHGELSTGVTSLDEVKISRVVTRGRPKGVSLKPIGTKYKDVADPQSFSSKNDLQKIKDIISWLIKPNILPQVLTGEYVIPLSDITELTPESVRDSIGSASITAKVIGGLKPYFHANAFEEVKKLIRKKKKEGPWTCIICNNTKKSSNWIECESCLRWSHNECVGLKKKTPSIWYCPRCQKK